MKDYRLLESRETKMKLYKVLESVVINGQSVSAGAILEFGNNGVIPKYLEGKVELVTVATIPNNSGTKRRNKSNGD